jgi:hypothetical protein
VDEVRSNNARAPDSTPNHHLLPTHPFAVMAPFWVYITPVPVILFVYLTMDKKQCLITEKNTLREHGTKASYQI